MNILISGGSGLIGKALTTELLKKGHQVNILTRYPQKAKNLPEKARLVQWDAQSIENWAETIEETDVVINLAGENLAGEGFFPKRWTPDRKEMILQSRLKAGKALTEAIHQAENKPAVFIQSSGIGIYGTSESKTFSENSPVGENFMAQMAVKWEDSTREVENFGVRRVIIRSGVVLSRQGGAFTRFLLPYRLFAGGTFGSGRQILSWIHIQDEIDAIIFLLENENLQGIFNLTAPEPHSYKVFGKTLGQVLKRPSWLPVPGFALRWMFGEVASVILEGQRVIPSKLIDSGFQFSYPKLRPALEDLLNS